MEDEDKTQISAEDRKKLVLTTGALDMALEMEAQDKLMGDVREDIIDLNEMAEKLIAKSKQIEGKRDEIRAKFWKDVRADDKQWFRRMTEAGLRIMYKRVKDPDTDTSQIQLVAVDEADEAFKQIKRIFRRDERDDIR